MGTKISALPEVTSPNSSDVLPIVSSGATKKVQMSNLSVGLTANKTVNFTAADTAATIQAAIDAEPKNLNGYTLTFQFADGSYSLNAEIVFAYFFGGELIVAGNLTENEKALHTNQAVSITSTSTTTAISFSNVTAKYSLKNIKLTALDLVGGASYAVFIDGCGFIEVFGCYIIGSLANGMGISFQGGTGRVGWCYFTLLIAALQSQFGAILSSTTNAEITTAPQYGLYALEGAVVSKDSTQPVGTVANELVQTGGVIR